ncbi:MAG: hypothetical protein NTV80_20840 [Verrucomicrobia bacterium]|nr:hypothetical protein [Verrucomicrobiota bacterium]
MAPRARNPPALDDLAGCVSSIIRQASTAMNDDELHDLIRRTHPKPEFSSSFQREIWARIAVAEQQSWTAQWQQWSESLFRWVAQPAPALAVVTAMLLLGSGLGRMITPDNDHATMRSAYVASINPLIAARFTTQP